MTPRRGMLLGLAGLVAGCAVMEDSEPVAGARGRVVLLRGLANIFSTGMDELEEKLRTAGYEATVHNHLEWRDQAEETIQRARAGDLPRPFAVVGHSLGADDGIRLAAHVGQAARLADILVTFDPVLIGTVPPGPSLVRNYYQTSGVWGRGLDPAPGFAGVLENRAVRTDNHFTIDKDPGLHQEVIALLDQQAARRRARVVTG